MADKKKSSKAPMILLVLLLGVVGVGVAGYLNPDLPVIGPLVGKFFQSAAAGVDKSGEYEVKITKVVLDPQEFKPGENIDIQVVIKLAGADGKTREVWDSSSKGAQIREVGKDELAANWVETPFKCMWQVGDTVTIEVWDRKGISDTLVAQWVSGPDDKTFPLKGTRTLSPVKDGKPVNARKEGVSQIVMEAAHQGPYVEPGSK